MQNIWKSHIPNSSGAGVGTVGVDVPPPPRQATLAAWPGTKQKIGKTDVKPYALRARSLRRSRLVGVASILLIFFQKSRDSAQSTHARQLSYTKRKPPAGARFCPFSRTFLRKNPVLAVFLLLFSSCGGGGFGLAARSAETLRNMCVGSCWGHGGLLVGLAGWLLNSRLFPIVPCMQSTLVSIFVK